jgi:hypothetical protein
MKDYYFKIWFANGNIDWYPATASNINSALEEVLTRAEQNAIKNNTIICDYILDWINN